MIDKIWIDLDGVIFDFYGRYNDLYKSHPKDDDNKNLFGERFDKFIIDRNFETLDLLPDAIELIIFLEELTYDTDIDVEILTSVGHAHRLNEVSKQKRINLDTYSIKFHPNFVAGKHLKYLYATPTSIIIDDTKSVITDWRKTGAPAIHHINTTQTLLELKQYL
jgi:hypothetical protein